MHSPNFGVNISNDAKPNGLVQVPGVQPINPHKLSIDQQINVRFLTETKLMLDEPVKGVLKPSPNCMQWCVSSLVVGH